LAVAIWVKVAEDIGVAIDASVHFDFGRGILDSSLDAQAPVACLSWRVPTTGDPQLLKIALAQVGLASIVAATVLLVAAPREWLVPGLLGLIPLAIFMAYRRWRLYRQSQAGSDNVWIDDGGVHWIDTRGEERTFPRDDVVGFHIGRDDDTLREVSSLTLQLKGGYESQPIELHPPATPQAVRRLLGQGWGVVERDDNADERYDALANVYGECHTDFQEWHWEGTRDELRQFFALIAAAADELPLPPPGFKPTARTVLLNRRDPLRLRISNAPAAHFDFDTLAAPAGVLSDIAARADAALAAAHETDDLKFDLILGPSDIWTFHLHVRAT
jgi:hypothetical protein